MDKTKVKSLQDLVRLAAEEYGDHPFIKEKAGKDVVEKSFNQFFSDTRKVASFLLEAMGGEKIHAATIGPTSYAYLVGYFGTIMGGNVTVPLDAQLACEDICDLMNRADVNVFFYDARYAAMLPAIKINCPALKTYVALQPHDGAENVLTEILEKYDEAQLYNIPSESLASIVYTSGTTGKAKGVMLTHGNLIDNAMCQDNESSPEDTSACFLSITFSASLVIFSFLSVTVQLSA